MEGLQVLLLSPLCPEHHWAVFTMKNILNDVGFLVIPQTEFPGESSVADFALKNLLGFPSSLMNILPVIG